jgi:hypothetical protein
MDRQHDNPLPLRPPPLRPLRSKPPAMPKVKTSSRSMHRAEARRASPGLKCALRQGESAFQKPEVIDLVALPCPQKKALHFHRGGGLPWLQKTCYFQKYTRHTGETISQRPRGHRTRCPALPSLRKPPALPTDKDIFRSKATTIPQMMCPSWLKQVSHSVKQSHEYLKHAREE